MFGYVKPELSELTMREFSRFRAAYCGTCHELQRSFGTASRFILNYDFVFLFMLLYEGTEPPELKMRRCPVSPLRPKCVCCRSDALTRASGLSVILAYDKLIDDVSDEKGGKRTKAKLGKTFLKGAYRKASRLYPEFDSEVKLRLGELNELESEGELSLDRSADKFALLLASASNDRVKNHMLYHLGRIIYIADAYNDLKEDLDCGRYNPVAARYGVSSLPCEKNVTEAVRLTLEASAGVLMADVELLSESYWTGIIKNTLYLGIPKMISAVLEGTYSAKPARLPRREMLKENGDTI